MPKRIIDGQTYNTDTARLIAQGEQDLVVTGQPDGYADLKVYQTRGGAFFLHTLEQNFRKDRNGNWQPVERNEFEPMTREEAEQWVKNGGWLGLQIELLSPTIGEPPEAGDPAEAVSAASLYIRVPTSLKVQIAEAAEADNLSVNAWAMRCMEACLARNKTKGE